MPDDQTAERCKTKQKNPEVISLSSERPANEFIDAVQRGRLVPVWRALSSDRNVVLIDDNVFASRGTVPGRIFHTSGALLDGRSSTCFSEDQPPARSPTSSNVLLRLECGLTTRINHTDTKTSMATLRRKLRHFSHQAAKDVSSFLPQSVQSQCRR